jgi:mono/diheme cytochrome c family protein
MLALETMEEGGSPGRQPRKFLDPQHIAKLGYLPNPISSANPEGLPLGFAVDEDKGRSADIMCDTFPATCDGLVMRQKWVGLNCSACHTSEIEIGAGRLRIEGAPALADFQAFEEEIAASLRLTLNDRARFDRFARQVLGGTMSIEGREALEAQITEQLAWQQALLDKNATPLRYGHGRLDAQGHILNKVAMTTRVTGQPTAIAADAPASYPFIWNTSQQGKIQWNGIANNVLKISLFGFDTDIGALIRNTSEVVGVFAHIDTSKGKATRGYDSSLRLPAMVALERQLSVLKSPRWPEELLGRIDYDQATRGKVLFDRMGCASCHQPLASDDTESPLKEVMTPLAKSGTDIFLACNTFLHRAKAGNFAGQKIFGVTGDRILETDFTRSMLVNTAVGAVAGQFDDLLLSLFTDVAPNGRPSAAPAFDQRDFLPGVIDPAKKARARVCLTNSDELLAYKARSLNGIWATPPYLHNGSVPTLYDLFLPAAIELVATREPSATGAANPAGATANDEGSKRPEVFGVGNRAFDRDKVGFVSDPAVSPYIFRVRDPSTGAPIPGNYNSGHDYGNAALTDAERYALVEYLKTL